MDTSEIEYEGKKCGFDEGECSLKIHSSSTVDNDVEFHSPFNLLPLELQFKILSYLTTKELCLSVAPVCRHWKYLAYEPVFWQKLHFDGCHTNILSLSTVLQRAKLLRRITLMLIKAAEMNAVLSGLQYCPLLEIIDFSQCDGISAAHFYTLVNSCPNVFSVNLNSCQIVDDEVISAVTGWKHLRTLILSFCNLVTDIGVSSLSQLQFLEELNIVGITRVTDRWVHHLI